MQHVLGRQALNPWSSSRFAPMGSPLRLGQAEPVVCEDTPEGGKRCSDGTYIPPGCPSGSPETVQGAPAPGAFPVVPVAIAAGAVAATAVAVLAGNRLGYVVWAEPYDKVQLDLTNLAEAIRLERAADAYNFSLVQEATKRKTDLVFAEKDAAAKLAEQERLWDQTHRNYEQMKAAEEDLYRIQGEKTAAADEAKRYREEVERNAANILAYRQQVDALIATLPDELKADGRRIIDPCYRAPGLQGLGAGLKFFGPPAGAFPVPWGPYEESDDPALAQGPGGECVCQQSGKRVPHEAGVPCASIPCPEGGVMVRVLPKALGHLFDFDPFTGAFYPEKDEDDPRLVGSFPVIPVTLATGGASIAATALLAGPSRFEGISADEYRRRQTMMNGPFLGQVPLRRA